MKKFLHHSRNFIIRFFVFFMVFTSLSLNTLASEANSLSWGSSSGSASRSGTLRYGYFDISSLTQTSTLNISGLDPNTLYEISYNIYLTLRSNYSKSSYYIRHPSFYIGNVCLYYSPVLNGSPSGINISRNNTVYCMGSDLIDKKFIFRGTFNDPNSSSSFQSIQIYTSFTFSPKSIVSLDEQAREQYELGYNNGFSDGENAGYNDGFSDGFTDGESQGFENGFQSGVDSVDTDSIYQQGYNNGYSAGSSAGYEEGFLAGIEFVTSASKPDSKPDVDVSPRFENYYNFMVKIIDFMKTPIDLWGIEVSYWGIFLFVIIGTMIFNFIGDLLNPYRG